MGRHDGCSFPAIDAAGTSRVHFGERRTFARAPPSALFEVALFPVHPPQALAEEQGSPLCDLCASVFLLSCPPEPGPADQRPRGEAEEIETQRHREHRGYDFLTFRLESREHRTIQGLDGLTPCLALAATSRGIAQLQNPPFGHLLPHSRVLSCCSESIVGEQDRGRMLNDFRERSGQNDFRGLTANGGSHTLRDRSSVASRSPHSGAFPAVGPL
jgi:hypothetical protein